MEVDIEAILSVVLSANFFQYTEERTLTLARIAALSTS